jgi:pimeloyl-ACP methyl ester carboxylesterase
MKLFSRLALGLLIAALLVSFASAISTQVVQAQTPAADYQTAPCMFTLPGGVQEGVDVTCGYLTVPERYEEPQGPTIRLAVAIIKSTSANPQADPVFFAQGGPGGSTIDTFTQILFKSPLRAERDLVLFDQRGTLYSSPKLACPEFLDETLKVLDKDLSNEETNRLYREAADACHARLVGEGVNLSAFNSVENAHDIASLREALGYAEYNFYGVSYGTLLGLHLMRDFPQGLRSVILDAVVPPQVDFNFEAVRTIDRAYTELFNACAADAECGRAYPNLEKVLFDLVDRLDKHPVTIQLANPETGEGYPALLNGDGMIQTLFQGLYSTELLPMLPKMIYDVNAGKYTLLERVQSILTFDQTTMEGMYYSVICAEDGTYDPNKVDTSGIRARLLKGETESNKAFDQVCKDWNVSQLGAHADEPVKSDIPTLILNGRFDPVTPEPYGRLVAQTLSKNYLFTFPNTGHGAINDSCADSMMKDFVAKPAQAPDAGCIGKTQIDFVTSKDVVDFPVLIKGLNLDVPSMVKVGALALLLLGLLTAWFVYPLAWLVRVVRGLPGRETPFYGHLAPWVALLAGLLALAFSIALVVATVQMIAANDSLILFGISASYRWIFIFPPLVALVAMAMALLAAAGWTGAYWSGWRKVYFILLTLSALGCVVLMAITGALTGLIG